MGNNRLLVIVGPTASGKTALAGKLAKKFNGEMVSVDSRQVYRHMDIGTGKDRPEGVKIWGYDLVEPNCEFSVAQYVPIARSIIRDIWKRGKLPILVGGTGLYLKGLLDGIGTMHVPKNEKLREELKSKEVAELFYLLRELNEVHADSLNESDKKNKRRLVRAIEIAKSGNKGRKRTGLEYKDILMIGLKVEKGELKKKIEKRVDERIESGFEDEVKRLIEGGVGWDFQSMQALGYRPWGEYLRGEISREKAIEKWKREEKKYAKRQMTWFSQARRVHWGEAYYLEGLAEKWYSSDNAEKS